MNYLERIVVDREIRFGRPTVKGTRISVADVLGYLAEGETVEGIVQQFPQLKAEDIYACLAFAADREAYARIA